MVPGDDPPWDDLDTTYPDGPNQPYDPYGESPSEAEPNPRQVKTLTGQLVVVALALLLALTTGLTGYIQSCTAQTDATGAEKKAMQAETLVKGVHGAVDQVRETLAKESQVVTQAQTEARNAANAAALLDVELEATYQATSEKLDAAAIAVDALAERDRTTRRRLSLLERAVKTALPHSPAMRRYQPPLDGRKRFSLRRVKKRLPRTAAAAAATVDPTKRPDPPPEVEAEPTLTARPPRPSP